MRLSYIAVAGVARAGAQASDAVPAGEPADKPHPRLVETWRRTIGVLASGSRA